MLQTDYVVVHLEQDKNKNEQYVLNEHHDEHTLNENKIKYFLLFLKLLTYFL